MRGVIHTWQRLQMIPINIYMPSGDVFFTVMNIHTFPFGKLISPMLIYFFQGNGMPAYPNDQGSSSLVFQKKKMAFTLKISGDDESVLNVFTYIQFKVSQVTLRQSSGFCRGSSQPWVLSGPQAFEDCKWQPSCVLVLCAALEPSDF